MAKRVNNKELIMSAILQSRTLKEASEMSGVSEATIIRAKHNDEFMEELEQRRKEILDTTCMMLQGHVQRAVINAVEIMNDTSNSPQVRLNACDLIIRNTCKLTDLTDNKKRLNNILKKLDELNIVDS